MNAMTPKGSNERVKLQIRNFRSIKEQDVDLAPITVVYGPTAAGKSSLLYALLTLKNIVLAPNQNSSSFFTFGSASLGGFRQVVFDHREVEPISLGLVLDNDGSTLEYGVALQDQKGQFQLSLTRAPSLRLRLGLPVTFPAGNQRTQESVTLEDKAFRVSWNGVTAQVQASTQDKQDSETSTAGNDLATVLNAATEMLREVAYVPAKRGFTRPHYSPVSVSPLALTEDEIASVLSEDKYLVAKVSHYLESIAERDFRVHFQAGSAVFTLDVTDKKTGLGTELVNDGTGINQLVHVLTRTLRDGVKWVLIEEPELHLHPSAVRGFAKALARMLREEDKRFLISTQSESLIFALFTMLAKHQIEPAQLAVYFARKVGRITQFEKQELNGKGQADGGLAAFVEAEFQDFRGFLGADRLTRKRVK